MPIVNPPVIPPAPPAPQRGDSATFEERNDAAVEYQFNELPPALNAISQAAHDNAVTAMNAALQAQGNANFKGPWSSLTGPLDIPASVYHDGDYWNLLVDIADVAASEPSASNPDWAVSVVRLADSFEIGDFRSSLVELDGNYLRRDGATYPISSYPDLAALLPSYPSDFEWEAVNIGTAQDVRAIIRLSEFELLAVASTIPSSDATDVLYSPNNGATWELRSTIAGMQATAIVRNPNNGALIAGGAARKYSISLNGGVSWSTPADLPSLHSSAFVSGMIYFADAYFAIGAGDRNQTSHVLRSTDGGSWTSVYSIPQSSTSDRGQGVALFAGADRVYVSWTAAIELGFAMSNSAGTTFTRQEVQASESNFPRGGVFTGDGVVAQFFLGTLDSTLDVLGTTNGTDWTERASVPGATSGSLRGVVPVFAGNVLVLNTGSGTVAVSNADAAEFDIQALPGGFSVTLSEGTEGTYGRPEISNDGRTVLFPGEGGMVARGIAVPAGQFRVPDDAPLDGWVKAKGTPVEDASQVVIKNLPAIVAAADNAAAAASSATAAAASATTAQDAAAEAQAIVWEGATGFPKIRPTLNIDFANSKTFDPRITFTRASAATYYDEMGILRIAAPGEPRHDDHDPETGECLSYLSEGSATNLLTYSEQFDNAAWTKSGATIDADSAVAPDGEMTMDRLVEDAGTVSPLVTMTPTFVSGEYYSISVFAKAGAGAKRYLTLAFPASRFGSIKRATFDIENGTFVTTNAPFSAGIKRLPGGIVRCHVSALATESGSGGVVIRLSATSPDPYSPYTGDGTSGPYIFGAQLNTGTDPGSYIKTEETAVTRAGDSAVMTGDAFGEWFNPDEGTVFVECVGKTGGYPFSLFGSNTFNRIYGTYTTLNRFETGVRKDGVFFNAVVENIPQNSMAKVATSYKVGDAGAAGRGAYFSYASQPPSLPVVSSLYIGGNGNLAGNFLNGHIRRIAYWPRRLTNEQLQALTAE